MELKPRIIWITPDRFDLKPDKSSWIEMARCLRELGWEVVVLTSRKHRQREESFDGLVSYVDGIDLPLVFRITVLGAIGRWLAGHARQGDIVVMNEDSLWLLPMCRRLGVHVHLDFRSLPVELRGFKRRLDWLLFWHLPLRLLGRRASSYSFITERLREEVDRRYRLQVVDHVIWQSAVNVEHFASRKIVGANDGGPCFRLFYHGSISRNRGIGSVIEAIALGGLPNEFEFLIVGDGPEREALQDRVRTLGLEQRVKFTGLIPYESVPDTIATADVCICPLPDRLEWNVSSPLKVFEYMAAGKPMILTPIPAHTDLFADSRAVVWTRGHEPRDIRDAILQSISGLNELVLAAAACPQLAMQRFHWRTQAQALHDHLVRRRASMHHSSVVDMQVRR